MKPDEVTCQNCGKVIDRGKWCSDKCRMAFKRKPEQKGEHEQPEQPNPNKYSQDTVFRDSLTKTDQTFYDRAMKDFKKPYYKFSDDVQEYTCAMGSCGKKFTTSLSMLRFCSYQHYSEALSGKK